MAKKKVSPHAKQIEALSKISKAISSDLYLEDILKLIVTVTAQVMRSKICTLSLLDEAKNELSVRATQSVSEEYNRKPNLKLGEGIAGRAAKENEPISVLDVREDPRYVNQRIAKKEGLRSLLCVPLNVKGRVIGVLSCYTSSPHRFSKTEVDVLTAVANQAAVAIENTELMVRSRVIQEELEARKLIERAKGILMKGYGLSEDEAFRKIQKYSMDSRRSMREIAEAIILTKEMSR